MNYLLENYIALIKVTSKYEAFIYRSAGPHLLEGFLLTFVTPFIFWKLEVEYEADFSRIGLIEVRNGDKESIQLPLMSDNNEMK